MTSTGLFQYQAFCDSFYDSVIFFPTRLCLVERENGFYTKSKPNTCAKDNFKKHLQIANMDGTGVSNEFRFLKIFQTALIRNSD